MELYKILERKKIKTIEIPQWGPFLRKLWEDNFADHLNPQEKKDIFLYDNDGFCGFLWHLFSYAKKYCLEEKEAEKAFNSEHKDFCYVFWQHSDYALIIENAGALNANDLKDEYDVYIVDKEFNWTYVKTHETGQCGPYFGRKVSNI